VRKGISIALLLLLLTNLIGPYTFFAYRAVQIKSQMRTLLATLPDDELELIKLSPEAYRVARVDEHEIKVGGKMFDIARTVEKNGEVFVYGVYDEDEDNLLSFLDAVLNNLQQDAASASPLFSLLTVLQYLPPSFEISLNVFESVIQAHTAYFRASTEYISVLDSPPPQIG
jgi:hypothetical protein